MARKLTGKQQIEKGYGYISTQQYEKAIHVFKSVIENHGQNSKMFAFMGLGDTLQALYEVELSEKMYQKSLILAENQENVKMIKKLEEKIERAYIFNEPGISARGIEFFMRSIMKILSSFGKTDWF